MITEHGKKKAVLAAVLAVALASAAEWSGAQDKPQASKPGAGMRGMEGMHGMQAMEGMGGMTNMMGGCPMMQAGAMAHGMPQLPPGNAKLQLQMHAEMMQKMGEVLAKYAAQVKEEKR